MKSNREWQFLRIRLICQDMTARKNGNGPQGAGDQSEGHDGEWTQNLWGQHPRERGGDHAASGAEVDQVLRLWSVFQDRQMFVET